MNYFAHAQLAARVRSEHAFVLGAVLPDFAHMLGVRIVRLEHPLMAAGAALHHETDAVFHAAPGFRTLLRAGVRDLLRAGLRRGPARGAAHVGLELLLDAALARDRAAEFPYRGALRAAPSLSHSIQWSDARGARRFPALLGRLLRAGPPSPEPTQLASRVGRALDPRPRLRLAPSERAPLERWLAATAGPVGRAAPELLAETLAGVRSRPTGSAPETLR